MTNEKLKCYIAGLDNLLKNTNADEVSLGKIRVKKQLAMQKLKGTVVKTDDKQETTEFVCETCGKVAKSKAGLTAHKRTHADNK